MSELIQTIEKLLKLATVTTASSNDNILCRTSEGLVTERSITELITLLQSGINQDVELVANKQNNLNVDNTNTKYPTITALLRATQLVWITNEIFINQVIRVYNNVSYLLLSSVAYPFTTTDISAEIIAGQWIDIKNTAKPVKQISDTEYVLVDSDANFILEFTSDSDVDVIVTSAIIGIYGRFEGRQLGTGTITFIANTVVINTRSIDSLSTSGTNSVFSLDCISYSVFILYGSLALL